MTSNTLAPVVRLTPDRRLALADRLIDLATAGLLLQHPSAHRLARLRATQFYAARTDGVLLTGVSRLQAFVADRAEDGIVLPEWHPCYLPSGVAEGGE